ncbi:sirohydrochlorin chelatase [Nonomuraea thailandensis]
MAEEIASVVRVDNPQIEVRLTSVTDLADSLPAGRDAVVVPLLTWDDPVIMAEIGKAVAASGSGAVVTEALGPHPLLAEALHIRLAERGLARADRVRLLNVSSPVDAVVLATVGGGRALHAVQATAVLLASRLTLPVVAASLDSEPGVDVAAQRLRAAGAGRLAIAPCLIGHEARPTSSSGPPRRSTPATPRRSARTAPSPNLSRELTGVNSRLDKGL